MVFEILTDKEIEALQERAIRQRNFYAANLLRWEADERSQPMTKPVQSPFVRCKDARRHAGWSQHPRTVRTRRLAHIVRRGKRLTLFERNDLEAAQARISWGELP